MPEQKQNQSTGAVEQLTGADDLLKRAKTVIGKESLPETRQMMLETSERAAKSKGELIRQQQLQEAKLAAGEAKLLKEEVDTGQRLMDQAQKEREQRRPVFEPTKENFQDFAAIFSGISALAFLVGGKGRGSGMQAMAALNGALDGWNKGRKDVFEKNIREYKTKLDEYKTYVDQQYRDLSLALQLGGKKTEAGRAALKEVVMRDNGGLIAASIESDQYDRVFKTLDNAAKGFQQIKAIETKAAATAANKAGNLSATEKKDKRGSERLLAEMKRLKNEFQDKFANKKFDTLGELESWVRERMGKDPAMANWWKSYENVAMPERHEMFGATLTGGERDAWRRASIGPGNSSDVIRRWFDERIRILNTKLDQYDSINDSRSRPNLEDDPAGIMQ